jgi:SAM-dependent methyltransferase
LTSDDLLGLLACPDCGGRLRSLDDSLDCEGCTRRFVVEGSVPVLLPLRSLGTEWEEKQELGASEYERSAETPTELARRFAGFAAVEGRVLDVGCGIEARPGYLDEAAGRSYVGVDPLLGTTQREFDFVQGIAEQLPFRDAVFDGALSATMLDHVPEPARVLGEIRRVLRPQGRLALWVGVLDEDDLVAKTLSPLQVPARPSLRSALRRHGVRGASSRAFRHLLLNRVRAGLTTLRLRFGRPKLVAAVYPERAKYHFWFFEAEQVLDLLRQTGFRVLATERNGSPASGVSLFVLAERST